MYKHANYLKSDWYLDEVYNDPDFQSDVTSLSNKEIMARYGVSEDEIIFYASGDFKNGRIINRRQSLSFYTDGAKKEITVKIGADATLSDFKNAWPIIKALKLSIYGKEERRYRSPDSPAIVYRVFRLKKLGMSHAEIFKLYEGGQLLKTSYNTSQFLTSKELIEYCRPYFPTT